MPERNFIHDSSVPNRADPIAAPIINCAIVPTTISDRAVEMRNQIESRLAISARPNHNAASAQTPVIRKPPIRSATSRDYHERGKMQTRVQESTGSEAVECQGKLLPTPSAR